MSSSGPSKSSARKPRHNIVQNFYHFDANNVGDQLSGPANYFAILEAIKRNFTSSDRLSKYLLLGGGLIFNQMVRLVAAAQDTDRAHSFVCWGAGIPPKGKRDREVRGLAGQFALFGTRNFDWSDEFDFVPCVSCMSSAFDSAPPPKHEVVVFAHQKKTPDLFVPHGIPLKTNIGQSARGAIEFISSGETVVTSSYHGVYWAQLLGRKVVCIPFSNKFETFQHQPFFSTTKHWMNELAGASQTAPLLEPYRSLNHAFLDKVIRCWELDSQEVKP